MPRNSRAVAVGYPHHITQRGNNCEPIFFDDNDHLVYLEALNHYTQKYKVDVWAYCLMTNHTHLLAVPQTVDGLAKALGLSSLKYTRHVNRKYFRSGRIWQGRFYSCIVDAESHLWAVTRYIVNNPVKARIVSSALDYRWSSIHHHLGSKCDPLLKSSVWLQPENREAYLQFLFEDDDRLSSLIGKATISGRPLCDDKTLIRLEKHLGRSFSQ